MKLSSVRHFFSKLGGFFVGGLLGAVAAPFYSIAGGIFFGIVLVPFVLYDHAQKTYVKGTNDEATKDSENKFKRWEWDDVILLGIFILAFPIVLIALPVMGIGFAVTGLASLCGFVMGVKRGVEFGFIESLSTPISLKDEISGGSIEGNQAFVNAELLIFQLKKLLHPKKNTETNDTGNNDETTFKKFMGTVSAINEADRAIKIKNNPYTEKLLKEVRREFKDFIKNRELTKIDIDFFRKNLRPFNCRQQVVPSETVTSETVKQAFEGFVKFSLKYTLSHGKLEHKHTDLAREIAQEIHIPEEGLIEKQKTTKLEIFLKVKREEIIKQGRASLGGNFMRLLDKQIELLEKANQAPPIQSAPTNK